MSRFMNLLSSLFTRVRYQPVMEQHSRICLLYTSCETLETKKTFQTYASELARLFRYADRDDVDDACLLYTSGGTPSWQIM